MGTIKLNRTEKRAVNRKSTSVIRKTRVAAYCRVSTDNKEQITSYHRSLSFYVDSIAL